MISSFKTNRGQTYSLEGCVFDGKDLKSINEYDIKYRALADQMKIEKKTHIFYNLKKYAKKGGYEYSQYFLVPIDAVDVEKIPLMFSSKDGTDYWYVIAYYHDAPDISYFQKMAIRESYWSKDTMTGYEYEQECADVLSRQGFTNIEVTPKSGDQGIDIIAHKDGYSYGIQCKFYQKSVSNRAVQEAFSGAKYYGCDIPVVLTNSVYTKSAKELATTIGVELWHIDLSEVG